jgi:hypothetical protein
MRVRVRRRAGTRRCRPTGLAASKNARVVNGSWVGCGDQTHSLGGLTRPFTPRSGRDRLRRFHTMWPVYFGLSRRSRTAVAVHAPDRRVVRLPPHRGRRWVQVQVGVEPGGDVPEREPFHRPPGEDLCHHRAPGRVDHQPVLGQPFLLLGLTLMITPSPPVPGTSRSPAATVCCYAVHGSGGGEPYPSCAFFPR